MGKSFSIDYLIRPWISKLTLNWILSSSPPHSQVISSGRKGHCGRSPR